MCVASSKHWRFLREGDLIDVVAPGFRPTDDEVRYGVEFLERWGFHVRLPKDLFAEDVIASNSDKNRFRHLRQALQAKDSRAIWCLRGGYGANRLVPDLMKLKRPQTQAKLLVGLSDVTTLHLFLNQVWGWPSLHASLVDRLARLIEPKLAEGGKPVPLKEQVAELLRVIRGEQVEIQFEGLEVLHRGRGGSHREGVSSGGNLVTYASAIGTSLHPKTAGRVIVFEDLGERGYRVDRLLEQLCQSRVFSEKTVAVIFGDFTGDQEPGGLPSRVPGVIERFAQQVGRELGIAVLRGLPVGHGVQQRSLPLGARSELNLRGGTWTLQTGGQA